jgi:hypothetical protein
LQSIRIELMLKASMKIGRKDRNLYAEAYRPITVVITSVLIISLAIIMSVVVSRSNAATPPAVGFAWHAGWGNYTDADNFTIVDKMAAAHMQWARIDIGWCTLEEGGQGQIASWYVTKLDTAINYANSKGIKVLGQLWCTPGWANGGKDRTYPPTDMSQYGRIAQWSAAHWKGKVQAWEVWNEPNHTGFWNGTTTDYANLLKASYASFHTGDPSTKVIFGAPSYNDDAYIDQVYAAGAKNYFDVMATHPYQGIANLPPDHAEDGNRWWFTHLPAVRNVMAKYGDSAKKVWFTEFGWSSHTNTSTTPNWQLGVTEQQQGDYFVKSIQYVMANYPYVENMIWYNDRVRTDSDIQTNNYGLLRNDLSSKPAYTTISQYLSSLYSNKVGDIDGDGAININDLSILLSNYNKVYAPADLNGDQIVNVFDLSVLLSNYGK